MACRRVMVKPGHKPIMMKRKSSANRRAVKNGQKYLSVQRFTIIIRDIGQWFGRLSALAFGQVNMRRITEHLRLASRVLPLTEAKNGDFLSCLAQRPPIKRLSITFIHFNRSHIKITFEHHYAPLQNEP